MFRKLVNLFRRPRAADLGEFRELFGRFQQILRNNNRVLEIISELEDKLGGEYIFDINYLKDAVDQISDAVYIVCSSLNVIADNRYRELFSRQTAIHEELTSILQGQPVLKSGSFVVDFDNVDSDMAELAGGKNANLGEIKNHLKLLTPDGFIITTAAYGSFMAHNDLWPQIDDIRKTYMEQNHDPDGFDRAIDGLFDKNARSFRRCPRHQQPSGKTTEAVSEKPAAGRQVQRLRRGCRRTELRRTVHLASQLPGE